MIDDDDDDAFRAKYRALSGLLDERSFRLCLAGDAVALGRGGISQIAKASGASRPTIHAGIRDLRGVASGQAPAAARKAQRLWQIGADRPRPSTRNQRARWT